MTSNDGISVIGSFSVNDTAGEHDVKENEHAAVSSQIPTQTDTSHVPGDEQSLYINKLVELLHELDLPQFASFEKCLPKLLYDSRFTSIPKEHRASAFLSARRRILDRVTVEKTAEQNKAIEEFKQSFNALLASKKITPKSTFKSILDQFSEVPTWNNPYLKQEKRDAFIRESIIRLKAQQDQLDRKRRTQFKLKVQNALEQLDKKKSSCISISDLKNILRTDPHYYDIESCTERHFLILDLLKKHRQESKESAKKASPHDSSNVSNKDTIASLNKSCRTKLEREASKQLLHSLLTERVKNPFELSSYTCARDLYLTTDFRLKEVDAALSFRDQEIVFHSFVSCLRKERLALLEAELNKSTLFETPNVTFEQADKAFQWSTDKRFKGITREEFEHRFQKWKRNSLEECKKSFETLLRTCALVNSQIPDEGPQYNKLLSELAKDPRYTRLDGFETLRDTLIRERLNELRNEASRLFV